ncbi:uncharacterized protein LOC120626396 isoform X1 [Pararge aegeria]|uniref:uncharacterized protein LOC120626396 isoform X1 n=1 Tax=Pararge aegeria TaxID=116150 RepID=UPI0019D04DDE|nr:uncharacterized protein LOC120626396 isoform X1 [Pararge aegeria]
MKSIIVLLAVICCIAVVRGAHLHKYEEKNIDNKHIQDHFNSPMRHNRRRRQPRYNDRHNNYGDNSIKQRKYYDRRDDLNDYEQERDYSRRNYLQRRDYDPRDEDNVSEQRTDYGRRDDYRRQSETFSKILDKLDEILFYMKMSQTLPPPSPPPPPPQVIFINVPHCNDNTIQTETETETRFLGRNWGKVVSDGSRPINFNIIKSDEPPVIPPPVEHGTIQAGCSQGMSKCKGNIKNIKHRRVQPEKVPHNESHLGVHLAQAISQTGHGPEPLSLPAVQPILYRPGSVRSPGTKLFMFDPRSRSWCK